MFGNVITYHIQNDRLQASVYLQLISCVRIEAHLSYSLTYSWVHQKDHPK